VSCGDGAEVKAATKTLDPGEAKMKTRSYRDRVKPEGQKKLLALDGGGIRGVIALEVLARIEEILRETSGRKNLVLSDYFDYIGGTSTGAIIAACLAVGMRVEDVTRFYIENGSAMFTRAGLLKRFWYKFGDDNLSNQLKEILGEETTLGSEKVRTLLMMVLRNATTDSPWPICNNPLAKYNDAAREDCNLNLPLWQLVRASTAAPTYFPPEVVTIGRQEFLFVDGGITMYNNPAFQLFLMATVEPYRLQWVASEDRMLVVSIGTGTSPEANANLQPGDMNLIYQAGSIPSAFVFAALNEQDFLCRVFGKTLAGCALDSEVGDMQGVKGPTTQKLFTYMRYNAELTREGLSQLGIQDLRPDDVRGLDSVDRIPQMQRVGQAIAKFEVKPGQFDGFPPEKAGVADVS
jgi:patatin-like phospholipase/acyl hydrolase